MLTGEYLVWHGAKSILIPTTLGQTLTVLEQPSQHPTITWTQIYDNKTIFNTKINIKEGTILETNDLPKSETLLFILHSAQQIRKDALNDNTAYTINTKLDFDPIWGLGSSSSLLVNISKWLKIDPYELNNKTFHSSGADIAAASSKFPLTYSLHNNAREILDISLPSEIIHNALIMPLGVKVSSRLSSQLFLQQTKNLKTIPQYCDTITNISKNLLHTNDPKEIITLLTDHEQLLSSILKMETIHKRLFPKYKGVVKQLGAWGGDTVLFYHPDIDYTKEYLQDHKPNTDTQPLNLSNIINT